MLTEIVYRKGFYLFGTAAEIRQRLAEHASKYATVRELLNQLSVDREQ